MAAFTRRERFKIILWDFLRVTRIAWIISYIRNFDLGFKLRVFRRRLQTPPIVWKMEQGQEDKVLKILNRRSFPPEILNKVISFASGNFEIVKKLLEQGADVNGGFKTPLGEAVKYNDYPQIQYLLSKGADIRNPEPFYNAVWNNNLEMVKFLSDRGAEVDPDNTLLTVAVEKQNLEMCKFLLCNGADPNEKRDNGPSDVDETNYDYQYGEEFHTGQPLKRAMNHDNYQIIKLLLEYGADPNLVDEEFYRGVAWRGKIHILDLLGEYSPDIGNQLKVGKTGVLL